MPIDVLESTPAAKKLVAQWAEAKNRERKASGDRIAIELKIWEMYEDELPKKGSAALENLKITTGTTDKWNQDELQEIRANWPDGCSVPFPFREELKPDGKAISYIKDHVPDVYEVLTQALTQDPRKPSFSID